MCIRDRLQLANAYAAIATRGKLHRPYIVRDVLDNQGKVIKKFEPELIRQIELKDQTWDLIQKGLYKVVNSPKGTAWYRRGLGNQMAGKTGTSQVVKAQSDEDLYAKCDEKNYDFRHHALFVAFAPFDKPSIAVSAFVEHGCKSSEAAKIVQKVVNTYMKKYLPAKYEENVKKEKAQLTQIRAKARRLLEQKKEAEEQAEIPEEG